jgi:Protein DA1
MKGIIRSLLVIFLLGGFTFTAHAFRCQVCGKDGFNYMGIFIFTDQVTGEQEYVCLNCVKLPRCDVCGLPVKNAGRTLPDGRVFCARDAKVAITDPDRIQRAFEEVDDKLNRMFFRFTQFATNVNVIVADHIDNDVEHSENGRGTTDPGWIGEYLGRNGKGTHNIRLLSGQPLERLKVVCAHELSHAWIRQNLSPARHARLSRDAEEGFCEMVAYLLAEAEDDSSDERWILDRSYTHGQVKLFVEAEKTYGFNQILEWLQDGETAQLNSDHPDEIRKLAPLPPVYTVEIYHGTTTPTRPPTPINIKTSTPPRLYDGLVLQGIIQGRSPVAIINGHSFHVDDEAALTVRKVRETIRCLSIQTNSVRVQYTKTGAKTDLTLP